MDYPYENLSPEKFQELCQSLLTKENAGIQCFPVAQPDGGRDATQLLFHFGKAREFLMFQVKYVRKPLAMEDPHDWLLGIIKSELPKVRSQIVEGAKMFVLITNVPGTAHPNAGSIDIANSLLTQNLGLPCMCWWRDDLNRRMDSAWDLKWTYPELMTGPDLIRYVIESNLTEHQSRRSTTIRAFVTNQYQIEQYVKFKQVELDNRLLDLFIDVPIRNPVTTHRLLSNRGRMIRSDTTYQAIDSVYRTHFDFLYMEEIPFGNQRVHQPIGAATFLLTQATQKGAACCVVEGAPGQGKSTITQYACQVHRMRLLEKTDDLAILPAAHRECPIRLPIKVDLRDFSAWLIRRNPFSAEAEEINVQIWEKSLESFLAALIRHQSGGAAFDVSDLHAVCRLSAVFLVLDGLDEIADIKRREEVVSEIEKGAERLKSISASLQVVVTSRPAAFENSPGLTERCFRYVQVDHVTPDLIDQYAVKWLLARRLEDRQSSEVKRILKEKLAQPHIGDLARNPMQLAILLSLIHTRGVSLPDKRTALYDNYVELFFNREAEKSNVVRDNRDLLIDIHRYLAWLLHVEAEQSGGEKVGQPTGAIEATRLKQVLRDYLISEERDPELADVLFTGLIERVVALVSRVEGTYEFEVQPLREYFAARFLHETAPYSPVGDEKRGTLPDRFDAIARNFYWLNVTRFYAGCYSKGELASLIDRLMDLVQDADFRFLSHPRVLGATLLADWVFTQHPKSVKQVVSLVIDGIGLRFLLASTSRKQSGSTSLALPEPCGRGELLSKCFEMLGAKPPFDYALDIIDLLKANGRREDFFTHWLPAALGSSGDVRTAWITYGLHLGCVPFVSANDLETLMADRPRDPVRIDALLRSGRRDYFMASDERRSLLTSLVLERRLKVSPDNKDALPAEVMGRFLQSQRYAIAFANPLDSPLSSILQRVRGSIEAAPPPVFDETLERDSGECKQIIEVIRHVESLHARNWATELSPWETLVDAIVDAFGENWTARHLASVASGIKSSALTCTDSSDLFDASKSLCRRARYARLRAGNASWWTNTLASSKSIENELFALELLLCWGSVNTLVQLLPSICARVDAVSDNDWPIFIDSVSQAVRNYSFFGSEKLIDLAEETIAGLRSERVLGLLWLRAKPRITDQIFWQWRKLPQHEDPSVLELFQARAMEDLFGGHNIDINLAVLADAYRLNIVSPDYSPYSFGRRGSIRDLSLRTAMKVAKDAERYPSFLVAMAEKRCRLEASKKIRPLGKVAEAEGWFKANPKPKGRRKAPITKS